MSLNLNNLDFTFHGDLLGVSKFYKISTNEGYMKLNEFYNLTYKVLSPLINKYDDIQIYLFSDSIFITGKIFGEIIRKLGYLYSILTQRNLLLRGAIVKGKLEFDPRLQLEQLQKKLPKGDVLFRAVELEKRVKGARLLIEKKLAQSILPQKWYSVQGYYENIFDFDFEIYDIRRLIRLTPDWDSYEFLWPIVDRSEYPPGSRNNLRLTKSSWVQNLQSFENIAPSSAKIQYRETKKLIKSIEWELKSNYKSEFEIRKRNNERLKEKQRQS